MKTIHHFRYKDGKPNSALSVVIDCRVLPNPHVLFPELDDEAKISRVTVEPAFNGVVSRALALLTHKDNIWVGCYGGKHRSVAVIREIQRLCPTVRVQWLTSP